MTTPFSWAPGVAEYQTTLRPLDHASPTRALSSLRRGFFMLPTEPLIYDHVAISSQVRVAVRIHAPRSSPHSH